MKTKYSEKFEAKKDWKDLELNKNLKKQIDNVLKD
jgi:hypothetical protein